MVDEKALWHYYYLCYIWDVHSFFCCASVTRRCFPALFKKGGIITVGNSSTFDDGSGNMRNAKDLVDGVKWVHQVFSDGMKVAAGLRTIIKRIRRNFTLWNWIKTQVCLRRNATVVIEARQVVMKIFEDYTQSWYWILMWVVNHHPCRPSVWSSWSEINISWTLWCASSLESLEGWLLPCSPASSSSSSCASWLASWSGSWLPWWYWW